MPTAGKKERRQMKDRVRSQTLKHGPSSQAERSEAQSAMSGAAWRDRKDQGHAGLAGAGRGGRHTSPLDYKRNPKHRDQDEARMAEDTFGSQPLMTRPDYGSKTARKPKSVEDFALQMHGVLDTLKDVQKSSIRLQSPLYEMSSAGDFLPPMLGSIQSGSYMTRDMFGNELNTISRSVEEIETYLDTARQSASLLERALLAENNKTAANLGYSEKKAMLTTADFESALKTASFRKSARGTAKDVYALVNEELNAFSSSIEKIKASDTTWKIWGVAGDGGTIQGQLTVEGTGFYSFYLQEPGAHSGRYVIGPDEKNPSKILQLLKHFDNISWDLMDSTRPRLASQQEYSAELKDAKFEKGVKMTPKEVSKVVGPEFAENVENPPPEVVKLRNKMEGKKASVVVGSLSIADYVNDLRAAKFTKGVEMTVDEVADVVGPEFKENVENPPPGVVKTRNKMVENAKTASNGYVDVLLRESITSLGDAHKGIRDQIFTRDTKIPVGSRAYKISEKTLVLISKAQELAAEARHDIDAVDLNLPMRLAGKTAGWQSDQSDAKGKFWELDGHGDFIEAAQVREIQGPGIPLYILYLVMMDGGTMMGRRNFKSLSDAMKAAQSWIRSDERGASLILRDFSKVSSTFERSGKTAAAGLYGSTKETEKVCGSATGKLAKFTAKLAKEIYSKDAETPAFLEEHNKRTASKSAKMLRASMTDIGPGKPAKIAGKSGKGRYGFSDKTARLALEACNAVEHEAGVIASDTHARMGAKHATVTGFLSKHAKRAKCGWSDLILEAYPNEDAAPAEVVMASKKAGLANYTIHPSVDEIMSWDNRGRQRLATSFLASDESEEDLIAGRTWDGDTSTPDDATPYNSHPDSPPAGADGSEQRWKYNKWFRDNVCPDHLTGCGMLKYRK